MRRRAADGALRSPFRRVTGVLTLTAVLSFVLVVTGTAPALGLGPFTTIVVDGANLTGQYTSLVLDSSGFPVISYYDVQDTSLKLALCGDASCTARTIRTVDNTDDVGQYTSLALNSSGFPVISYYDVTNTALKLATCNDATCTAPTLATVDGTGTDVGMYSSLAMGSSDLAVISYRDDTYNELLVAACVDASCDPPAISSLDSGTNDEGEYTSMAMNGSGNPVISYYDLQNDDLRLATCTDPTCNVYESIITTVDGAAGDVGTSTSLAINGSGNPVISYYDVTNTALKLATCNDATCDGVTLTTVDGTTIAVGQDTSLALNSSGNPVISYYDATNTALKLATCNDAICTAPTLTTVDDASSGTGRYTSLALNSAGNPVISYFYPYDVKLAFVPSTSATVDVYAGATASAPPAPNAPTDLAADSPPAAAANLGWPTNMAFDAAGNLYFTDRYNHTIRRVAAAGGAVTTVAGTPGTPCPLPTTSACGDTGAASLAQLRSPWGITVDTATPPNIYVTDYGNHRVRRIAANADPGAGVITTIAGTGVRGYDTEGTATAARLNHPSGLTLDSDGAVLVADRGNHRIRRISAGVISTFLGTGTAGTSATSCSTVGTTRCTLDQPSDIEARGTSAVPSVLSTTDFFIADRGNDTVLTTRDGGSDGITADRLSTGVAGYADGIATTARFDQPVALAYDSLKQQLYVADSNNRRIRRYSLTSQTTSTVAGDGTGKLGAGTYVTPTNTGGAATATAVNFPIGVAFLPGAAQAQGSAYFSAVYENQIRKLTVT